MFHPHEQRAHQRIVIGEGEQWRGLLDRASLRSREARLLNITLNGAALGLEEAQELLGAPSLLHIQRRDQHIGDTNILAVHSPLVLANGPPVVGVRFLNQSESFLRQLSMHLVETHSQIWEEAHFCSTPEAFEVVEDEAQIARMLRYFCQYRCTHLVHNSAGRPLGQATPYNSDGQVMSWRLHFDLSLLRPNEDYLLAQETFSVLYLLPVRFLRGSGSVACFTVPSRVMEGGFRRFPRLSATEDYPVRLEFIHPHIPGRLISKEVREVGLGGVSIPLDLAEDILVAGTRIASAVLRLPEGEALSCRGLIRYTAREGDGGFVAGIELVDFAGSDRLSWTERVLTRLSPNITVARDTQMDDVWEVFERSGYLDEKPRETMLRLREKFSETWSRLNSVQGQSRCWVYYNRGEPVGTVAISRFYRRAWLAHHFACDLDRYEEPARKLLVPAHLVGMVSHQWLAVTNPDAFLLFFLDATKKFNRWAWIDFYSNLTKMGVVIEEITLTHLEVDDLPSGPSGEMEVAEATDEERLWISRHLRELHGEQACEALAYDPAGLTLSGVEPSPDWVQMRRERALYVAHYQDKISAYALFESAVGGVNLFSLYDICRIVAVDLEGEERVEAARQALLFAAKGYYQQRNIKGFLYLYSQGDLPLPEEEKRFSASAVRLIVPIKLVPRLVVHLNRIWVHR